MNKRQIIASLNKIANELDNSGMYNDANKITNVMVKISQNWLEDKIQRVENFVRQYDPRTKDEYTVKRTSYPGTPQQKQNFEDAYAPDVWKYMPLVQPSQKELNSFIAEHKTTADFDKFGALVYYNLYNRFIPNQYLKYQRPGRVFPQSIPDDSSERTDITNERMTREYLATPLNEKNLKALMKPGLTDKQIFEIFLNTNPNLAQMILNHYKSWNPANFAGPNAPAYLEKMKQETGSIDLAPVNIDEKSGKFSFNRNYYVKFIQKVFSMWLLRHNPELKKYNPKYQDIKSFDFRFPSELRDLTKAWIRENVEPKTSPITGNIRSEYERFRR